MPTLPNDYLSLIQIFAPHFSNCIWQHAQVLLLGAILAPGRRTVTAVLRINEVLDGDPRRQRSRTLDLDAVREKPHLDCRSREPVITVTESV